MDLEAFCNSIKEKYPGISERADKLYDERWNDYVETEFSAYSWFESLANAVNQGMMRKSPVGDYVSLFNTISQEYSKGQSEVVRAIDVAFVENLYWRVPASEAKPFWVAMPDNLKDLYVDFHGNVPL